MTTDDKIKIRLEYINQCILKPYEALKQGNNKFERNHTNHLFKFLYSNKLITPTGEELQKYKNKALGEMLDNAAKYTNNVKEKNLFKIEMVNIRNGGESHQEGKVKQEAAHLYTVDWLKALINSGADLGEFLKENGFYKLQNN